LCRNINTKNAAQCGVPISKSETVEIKRFGANLRRARSARGITQERLAELADLNIRTVQKIEAGQTNILVTTAKRLRHALSCSWSEILG
jgi:transcriptional regulator with XRE-family HTH domain